MIILKNWKFSIRNIKRYWTKIWIFTVKKCQKNYAIWKSNNRKEYCQILNRVKKKTQPNIPTESLFEYFKELNSTPNENENSTFSSNIDPYDVNCVNKDLNQKITQKEIIDCIKRLKNNKASVNDRVIRQNWCMRRIC